MKLAAIKKLVETYDLQQLEAAEAAITEEKLPSIEIEGEDEGEQLTHVYAAMEVLKAIQQGKEMKDALRDFASRVRGSIS